MLLSELDITPRAGKPRRLTLITLLQQVRNYQDVNVQAGQQASDWVQFLCWYQKANSQFQEFEARFVRFIEDEREKEGRLFNRWVALADLITQQFLDKQAGHKPRQQKGSRSQPYVPGNVICTPLPFVLAWGLSFTTVSSFLNSALNDTNQRRSIRPVLLIARRGPDLRCTARASEHTAHAYGVRSFAQSASFHFCVPKIEVEATGQNVEAAGNWRKWAHLSIRRDRITVMLMLRRYFTVSTFEVVFA